MNENITQKEIAIMLNEKYGVPVDTGRYLVSNYENVCIHLCNDTEYEQIKHMTQKEFGYYIKNLLDPICKAGEKVCDIVYIIRTVTRHNDLIRPIDDDTDLEFQLWKLLLSSTKTRVLERVICEHNIEAIDELKSSMLENKNGSRWSTIPNRIYRLIKERELAIKQKEYTLPENLNADDIRKAATTEAKQSIDAIMSWYDDNKAAAIIYMEEFVKSMNDEIRRLRKESQLPIT